MKDHEDRYVAAVEKHTLAGANAITLMNTITDMWQRCAWTGFWIRSPASANRIRSEVSFVIAEAGFDLHLVFAEICCLFDLCLCGVGGTCLDPHFFRTSARCFACKCFSFLVKKFIIHSYNIPQTSSYKQGCALWNI